MPGSIRENDHDLRTWVADHPDVHTVLDIGPGRGTYARVLDGLDLTMDAVEVWRRYIARYDLRSLYRHVQVGDVRDVPATRFATYDLIVFGDVIEHLTRDDALAVWDRARAARYALISVPIVHYPQGAVKGNPHEEHLQDLSPDSVCRDYGPFTDVWLYQVTGTFIRGPQ